MTDYILVIDEGTTSTRAAAYDRTLARQVVAQAEIELSTPEDGWVEQSGTEIWEKSLHVCHQVIEAVGGSERIAAIAITNQRETTLVWDRKTGIPVAPAIVWQDRRTSDLCETLKAAGHETAVQAETGLLLDPYFSATKIAWFLENTPGAHARAAAGELAFGTIDSYLIWHLTGGAVHATDVTNASRTMLYTMGLGPEGGWSSDMLALFGVPENMLPEIRPSACAYGETDPVLFGRAIPILSAIGDQQAALVGQACLAPGMAKITYGTGAFLVANTGPDRPASQNRLLGTIAYEAGVKSAYALEGSIFNAGTVVQWLRDEMDFFSDAAESEALASKLSSNGGVYFVPAFTGMGAPYWNTEARGQITGITRDTRLAHIVRAGLEAAAYQTVDLLEAFAADGVDVSLLRADGGMAGNDWLMQFLADVTGRPVERPADPEMTALGAAVLAAAELSWLTLDEWASRERVMRRFEPQMHETSRRSLLAGWHQAIERALA